MKTNFDRESERLATVVHLATASAETRQNLVDEFRARSEAAFAPATLRNYRQIIANFAKWSEQRELNAAPPVDPRVVAEFVEDMGGKLKSTTIETRLWAISEMHRAALQPTPCRHRLVELALKGVKRRYGAGVRQAPPLSKKEVLEAIKRLGDSRLELRDKACSG